MAIVQSSGSGKTRLVGELRNKGVYILYICKRHENNSGYPTSTPLVNQIFGTIRDCKFGVLLSSALKVIKKNNWNEEEFWNIQIKLEHKEKCNCFWKDVFETLKQDKSSSDCSNKNFVKELFSNKEICAVCCIDEAHELLTKIKGGEAYFIKWK